MLLIEKHLHFLFCEVNLENFLLSKVNKTPNLFLPLYVLEQLLILLLAAQMECKQFSKHGVMSRCAKVPLLSLT